jgi:hypothetical protein
VGDRCSLEVNNNNISKAIHIVWKYGLNIGAKRLKIKVVHPEPQDQQNQLQRGIHGTCRVNENAVDNDTYACYWDYAFGL